MRERIEWAITISYRWNRILTTAVVTTHIVRRA